MHKYHELATAAFIAVAAMALAHGPARAATAPEPSRQAAHASLRPCQSVTADETTTVVLGKSRLIRLPFPVARMVVGGQQPGYAGVPIAVGARAVQAGQSGASGATSAPPDQAVGIADTSITLVSPTELYLLGHRAGAMNVVLQAADGRCLVKDIVVTPDAGTLQGTLAAVLPEEKNVRVLATEGGLLLTGTVSDAAAVDTILSIASTYGGQQRKPINLLQVGAAQQVMLEVKIAEVSKTVLDHLNLDFTRLIAGSGASGILSGIIGGGPAVIGRFGGGGGAIGNTAGGLSQGANATALSTLNAPSSNSSLTNIDAQQKDGIVRVLAEPNILAVSGQAASFLSGGKIFIPVAQSAINGGTTVTLEEKEFGVGLKFTPTVLGGSRINLKLVSEVSELQQTGSPFTTASGVTSILPSMATRRVDTTVQLHDGQSFMVAGLIRNNVAGAIDKFPGLGDTPVMGALFRSTEFQNNQTELMFVVTPRLVRPMAGPVALPTDNHVAPSRNDVIFGGRAEGSQPLLPAEPPVPAPATSKP